MGLTPNQAAELVSAGEGFEWFDVHEGEWGKSFWSAEGLRNFPKADTERPQWRRIESVED